MRAGEYAELARNTLLADSENYVRAFGFLERLRHNSQYVTTDQFKRLKKLALEGHLESAERQLGLIIKVKSDIL